MKVEDILKLKGKALFTITPEVTLQKAVELMAEHDIGSVMVMEFGELVGILTFREVIAFFKQTQLRADDVTVRKVMDLPLTCTLQTELAEVCRMMLKKHARYMPVMNNGMLMGVISFYDVANAVLNAQMFENRMLKAFIQWPQSQESNNQ